MTPQEHALPPDVMLALLTGAPCGIYVYRLENHDDDRTLRFLYGNRRPRSKPASR
jgi:hypothetical protein